MLDKYGAQGLKIITVNLDEDKQLATQFLTQNPANFDIIYDPQGKAASQFKLKGMPMSFVIDRNGKLHSSHVGFNDEKQQEYEATLINLLTVEADKS